MFLPLSVLVYSHVTLHESLETGPGITSLLAIGVVRGELERKEQFYLHYAVNDGISRLSQLFCWKPDSPTENIPTYFNRHAYMMECDKTREVSYVSFKDFNPNGEVTFYDNTIYFFKSGSYRRNIQTVFIQHGKLHNQRKHTQRLQLL